MQVDLYDNMRIDSIKHRGQTLPFTREFNAVFINFPASFSAGEQSEIKIYYEGVPQVPDFSIPMHGGVLWDKDSLGNPWAQVVCQGSGASLWWPNKDHQSDEPDSMRIWITIPSAFTEVSNGRLLRKTPMPGDRMRYEWFVSYPINNYNATFNIGKYTHFEDRYISDDTLTIDYYVIDYNLVRAKRLFKQVIPMLKTFEKYFGKYPFSRDGFTLVESLYPMEHQSGVCIGKITQQNSGETNPLMWHEVAHEWWGNSITSKDIADMWIHEAFATYAESLIIEDWIGKDEAKLTMLEQMDAVIGEEPVTGVYDVNHIHYDIGDMYSKGSIILHTFRNVLNDDGKWIQLLRDIQKEFHYQTLSSDELVAFICKQTKTDYKYFFDQYLHYVDLPELQLQLATKGKDLQVRFRWHAHVKNFHMPVKIATSDSQFEFIKPTSQWQTLLLKNMPQESFDVDDENFYIKIKTE
jgi:aminopeptidase N